MSPTFISRKSRDLKQSNAVDEAIGSTAVDQPKTSHHIPRSGLLYSRKNETLSIHHPTYDTFPKKNELQRVRNHKN